MSNSEKKTSQSGKEFDGKIKVWPVAKIAAVLPQPLTACAVSPVVPNKMAGAGSMVRNPEQAWPRNLLPSNLVVPVRLWRNPYAVPDDAPTLPATVVTPSCSTQSAAQLPGGIEVSTKLAMPALPVAVQPPSSYTQSAARLPELKSVVEVSIKSAAPSKDDGSAVRVPSSDAILVVRKLKDGTTFYATRTVPSNDTMPLQNPLTRTGGLSIQAPAATSIGPYDQKISPLPSIGPVATNTSKPGLREDHNIVSKQLDMGVPKLQNCTKDSSSPVATERGDTNSSSLQRGKHPPAVVHVSSAPKHGTVRELLQNLSSGAQPAASNTPPMKQSQVSVSVKQSDTGASVLQKEWRSLAPGVTQPQVSQEKEDDGYGIKIISICSLAEKDASQARSNQLLQVAAENNSGSTSSAATSNKSQEGCQNISPEKVPEFKDTQASTCTLQAGKSGKESDIIELCSFQMKEGNSMFASQIAFKPAPSTSNLSGNVTLPCAKSDKLKTAIKLFEESMMQDTGLFSEGEKNILSSLFHRAKNDTLTAELEAGDKSANELPLGPSKFVIKSEPVSPHKETCDSVFSAQEDERPENFASQNKPSQLPEKVAIKVEPTSPEEPMGDTVFNAQPEERLEKSTTQFENKTLPSPGKDFSKEGPASAEKPAVDSVPNAYQKKNLCKEAVKKNQGVTSFHKPLRRIVITSDEVPMISSEEVKAGITAFLNQNNISNDFSEDEIIKLHWDGKDVSSFNFRDADKDRSPSPLPPPNVPVPPKIKPNILRCSKPAAATIVAGREVSSTATVSVFAGGQTGSSTRPVNTDTLQGQPKVSSSKQTLPAGYTAVRVKCLADSNQVVLTPLEPSAAIGDGSSAAKQLCFMPRAIRYVKNGEVIEKPLKPGQQAVPVVAPIDTKAAPLHQKSAICLTSAPISTVSSGTVRQVLPGIQTTATIMAVRPQPAKPVLAVAPSVPVTARIVRVNAEVPSSQSQSLGAGFPELLGSSLKTAQAPRQKPVHPAVSGNASNLLEPDVRLRVSNRIIQVRKKLDKTYFESSSSSSSSSSCLSEDCSIPAKAQKKTGPGRKRAPARSSVQRDYRSRKRRRQNTKRNPPAPRKKAKPSVTSHDAINGAILPSNCIDRPCVVSMYHLNDSLMSKGFVNLASVKRKELFVLVDTPDVRLTPNKMVSVVKLNSGRTAETKKVALTEVSETVPQDKDAESLECLLTEQKKRLVQLRKRYHELSP